MCWKVVQTLIMNKIAISKESAHRTVKTTKKIPLLFVPLIIIKLSIFLTGIVIHENRQDAGFKHKSGFKAAHVLLSAVPAHGELLHLPTHTNLHLTGSPLQQSIYALSVNPLSLQSPGEGKKKINYSSYFQADLLRPSETLQ